MKKKIFTVEFMGEGHERNDMPDNLHVLAASKSDARKKLTKHMKKHFPRNKIKIESIYEENLRIKHVDVK